MTFLSCCVCFEPVSSEYLDMDLGQGVQSDVFNLISQIDFPKTSIIVSFSHFDPLSGFVFCLHGPLKINRGPCGPNLAEGNKI